MKLQVNTGEIFDIENAEKYFGLVKNMMEVLEDLDVIPLKNVSKEVFEAIVAHCEHYKDSPVLSEEEMKGKSFKELPDWDNKFLSKFSRDKLFEIMESALYLDNKRIFWALAKKIASELSEKTSDEIREILDIPPSPYETEAEVTS